jgi:anti-sigma regulatory factor (Ser/Thr protein kinase)
MAPHKHEPDFRHAALFYSDDDSYVQGLVPFITDGVESGEPVLVMVPGRKGGLLREALHGHGDAVHFADMAEVGANPARIIPLWRAFAERAAPGTRLRGIGEPIWAGRTPDELVECQHHEELINVAFDGAAAMDLVCPYDEEALDPSIVDEALSSHPIVLEEGRFRDCATYQGAKAAAAPFRKPLSDPPENAFELPFDLLSLDAVRGFMALHLAEKGFGRWRRDDIVLAVNELASNSVRHGGGAGVVRAWADDAEFVAEVADHGQIDEPLAGRQAPRTGQIGGHGLWLVNQLCDLMQMRTFANGSVVRAHFYR